MTPRPMLTRGNHRGARVRCRGGRAVRVADPRAASLVAPCAAPRIRPSHQCALISYAFEQTRASFGRKSGASPLPRALGAVYPRGGSRSRRAKRHRAEGREGR